MKDYKIYKIKIFYLLTHSNKKKKTKSKGKN